MSVIDNKLYNVAGTSVRQSVKKYRFATSSANARGKVLTYNNHTDVELFDLDTPMTKADAIVWLAEVKNVTAPIMAAAVAEPMANVEDTTADADADADAPQPPVVESTKKAKKAKKANVALPEMAN